jgi:ectoine hydroxylase-related dioxygenase (phytanoyl-CoA dioxygenase family)
MDWKDSLKTLGYAVIPVLTESEVRQGYDMFQKWRIANSIPVASHGVLKHYRVGHTGFAWWCRTRPVIIDVFKDLWQNPDLIVSYDGACYLPPNLSRRNSNWLHVDQAPKDPHFKCVQGFVAFTNNREATLTLVPGSHLFFGGYMESKQLSHATPWQKVDYDLSQTIRVKVNAGDLVLWDSRVFHQNTYSSAEERLVQYLCYIPRYKATKKDLEKRQKYFQQKRTTSHWPSPIRVNSLQPQVYGRKELLIDYATLEDPDSSLLLDLENSIKKLI